MRNVFVAVTVLFIACEEPFAGAEEQRPNVLFIAIDDLNNWVGCMGGHPNAITPNMDALAARGVRFTNAHCQAPICGPSRASLFTGLLPSTTGIYGQIKDSDIPSAGEAASKATLLPDYFEQHGYKTLAAGKLFHNGDAARVFDEYGAKSSFGPKPKQRFKYDPAWFPEKIGSTQTDWGAFPDRDELMPDFDIAAFGVEQLQKEHDRPFFLAVGFMRPHVPWYVPQKWFDMHPVEDIQLPPYLANDLDDVPEMSRRVNELTAMPTTEWAKVAGEWRNIVQSFLACTTFVDAQVGKVLNALQASRYASNTVVILWSDHGYHVGEKNRFAKQALWAPATRMPLIVSAPGMPSDQVCNAPVGLIDLYPTLLDLCELPANEMNEGHTLTPLLEDVDADWKQVAVTTYGQGNHAVQTERYRFYEYEDGSQELYDHAQDPNEWENLAPDVRHQELIKRMRAHLPRTNVAPSLLITMPTNEYFLEKAKSR